MTFNHINFGYVIKGKLTWSIFMLFGFIMQLHGIIEKLSKLLLKWKAGMIHDLIHVAYLLDTSPCSV